MNSKNEKRNRLLIYIWCAVVTILAIVLAVVCIKNGIFSDSKNSDSTEQLSDNNDSNSSGNHGDTDIPAYSGKIYVELNGNVPHFDETDMNLDAFESYSELDSLGRCGVAYAKLGRELMPTEERENISDIHPTGWVQAEYDIVEQGKLWNRSHLIAFSLAGENANENNLITGTRHFNADGMEPFESMIVEYINNTDNHVMYRVNPIFTGDNLVADGVHMEAYSVEDNGAGICFNVFVYNVQPGIVIDYATGDSRLATADELDIDGDGEEDYIIVYKVPDSGAYFVLNTYSMKFHYSNCESVDEMSEGNKAYFEGTREELIEMGYTPCKSCKP